MATFVKAQVTESNGEISCSVEETNRIRALLGLRPLNEGPAQQSKDAQAVENFRKKKEDEEKALDAAQVLDRLEKAQTQRLLKQKLAGKGLGSIDATASSNDDSALVSAADWVRRSRIKEVTNKLAADSKQAEHETNRQNYESENLKGLQVMHADKDFELGESVILTLADTGVLDKDDQGKIIGVSEKADMLENINMAESERRTEKEKKAKRARLPAYLAYDDAEFDIVNGNGIGSRPNILAQYDNTKQLGPQLTIGSGGYVNSVHIDKEIDAHNSESLTTKLKPSNDFYTAAEYQAVDTKKSTHINEKKKPKRIRKREIDPEDQEVQSLDAILEQVSDGPAATGVDRGSRSGGTAVTAIMRASAIEENRRKESYEEAVRIAEEKTARAFLKSAGSSSVAVDSSTAFESVMADNHSAAFAGEDAGAKHAHNLIMQLRARDLQLLQDKQSQAMAESKTDDEIVTATIDSNSLDAEGRRRSDGTLVFSDTTEFSARLMAQMNEKARQRAEQAVKEQERRIVDEAQRRKAQLAAAAVDDADGGMVFTRSAVPVKITASSAMEASKTSGAPHLESSDTITPDNNNNEDEDDDDAMVEDDDQDDTSEDHGHAQDKDAENDEDDEQMAFLHRQPLAARGMAATLMLLKSSGELNKREELAGRAKDSRSVDPSKAVGDVKLEYRDENGRKLTQKESFRQLSYKFHGYGPGKKKLEKRRKSAELQNRSGSSVGSLDTGTMKSLTRAQEATGKAHILVQGGGGSTAANTSQMAAALMAQKQMKKKPTPKP